MLRSFLKKFRKKHDFNVNQEKNKQVFKFAGKQFHKT